MFGPSGFFQSLDIGGYQDPETELEIFHVSEFGFNVLYRGNKNGRFFIYKALKPEFRGNIIYENLLKKDFNIGFNLIHNNICQYYGMVNIPEIGNCIIMEWIDGCSLETLIETKKIGKKIARKIICETCDALEYIHKKQIIHRDLKPENIIITYNGLNVKVIDFGLSDADSFNTYKAPAGTKIYASPELLVGEGIDCRSDIYSLGLIINEISSYYRKVAAKCSHRLKEKRYQNAENVKKAILNEPARRMGIAALYSIMSLTAIVGITTAAEKIRTYPQESIGSVLVQADTSKIEDTPVTGSADGSAERMTDAVKEVKTTDESGSEAVREAATEMAERTAEVQQTGTKTGTSPVAGTDSKTMTKEINQANSRIEAGRSRKNPNDNPTPKDEIDALDFDNMLREASEKIN